MTLPFPLLTLLCDLMKDGWVRKENHSSERQRKAQGLQKIAIYKNCSVKEDFFKFMSVDHFLTQNNLDLASPCLKLTIISTRSSVINFILVQFHLLSWYWFTQCSTIMGVLGACSDTTWPSERPSSWLERYFDYLFSLNRGGLGIGENNTGFWTVSRAFAIYKNLICKSSTVILGASLGAQW